MNKKGFILIILLASLLVVGVLIYFTISETKVAQKSSIKTKSPNITTQNINRPTPSVEKEIVGPAELTEKYQFATFHLGNEPNALRSVQIKLLLPQNTTRTSNGSYVYSLNKEYRAGLSIGDVGYELPGKHNYVSEDVYINNVKFTKEKRFVDNKLKHIFYTKNETFENMPYTMISFIALPENINEENIDKNAISTLEKIIASIQIIKVEEE